MMDGDIMKDLVNKMMEAIQQEAGKGWKEMSSISTEFKNAKAKRLQLIVDLRLSGDLDEAQFAERLEQEKKVTESELHALQVMAKGTVQKSVNQAFAVFEKALIKILGLKK